MFKLNLVFLMLISYSTMAADCKKDSTDDNTDPLCSSAASADLIGKKLNGLGTIKTDCPECRVQEELKSKTADIQKCTHENTTKAPVGFQCMTSKNALFTRVEREGFGVAWKDPKGVIWGNDEKDEKNNYYFSQKQGRKICENKKARLPSKEDYKAAEDEGFREVVDVQGLYWTSSMRENSSYFGISVHPGSGNHFNSEDYRGLAFEIQQQTFLPYVNVLPTTYPIKCIDNSNK